MGKKKRCQTHTGERGGRYYMERVRGKPGTQRRYLKPGERPPMRKT